MNSQSTPIQLLSRIVKKEKESFSLFYDHFSGLVYAVALRILRSPHDAEELVQDVFWKVWETAADYNASRGAPEAWLVTITRTRAIDRLRSSRRRRESSVALDDAPEVESLSAGDPRSVFEGIWARGALQELSDLQRQVLELAYFEGLTQSEIAERLKTPLGTIKTRIRDGLQKLREKMTGAVAQVKS